MQFPLGVPILEAEREDRKGNGRRDEGKRRQGGRGREGRIEMKERRSMEGEEGGEGKGRRGWEWKRRVWRQEGAGVEGRETEK